MRAIGPGRVAAILVSIMWFTSCGGSSKPTPVVLNPTPILQSTSPSSAFAGSGAFTMTLNGSGFLATSIVTFGGVTKTASWVNDQQLTLPITEADLAAARTVVITVSNPGPGGGQSTSQFIVQDSTPVITSITPSSADFGCAPFTLTIKGTNFLPGAWVNFGAPQAATFVDSTTLTTVINDTMPQFSHRSVLVFQKPDPDHMFVSNNLDFVFISPAPEITSSSPQQVIAGTRLTLVVTGSGFVRGSVIRVGSQDLQTTFVDSTRITASLTWSKIGSQTVTVVNPEPSKGGPSNPLSLDVAAEGPGLQPTVASIDSSGVTVNRTVTMSRNGRYVAFGSDIRDTCLGAPTDCIPSTIRFQSTDPSSPQAYPQAPPTSDGRYVLSRWAGGNPLNAFTYFSDTCLGASPDCTPNSKQLWMGWSESMSSDGRYISHSTWHQTLRPGFGIYDLCTGAAPDCTPHSVVWIDSCVAGLLISDNARHGVYAEIAPYWYQVTSSQVFLHDFCIGATPECTPSRTMISDASLFCERPSISSDAQFAVYQCGTNIYLQRTCAGVSNCERAVTLVSTAGLATQPLVSNGGRFVAFTATDPTLDDLGRVYVFDTCEGAVGACVPQTKLVCKNPDGAVANSVCYLTGMTSDASHIAFYSGADNLVPGVAGASYIVPNPLK